MRKELQILNIYLAERDKEKRGTKPSEGKRRYVWINHNNILVLKCHREIILYPIIFYSNSKIPISVKKVKQKIYLRFTLILSKYQTNPIQI